MTTAYDLTLTIEEILYLEETLRYLQRSGGPIGFDKKHDLAQQILDKLESK